MDHIEGLGFFRPLHDPDLEIHVWGPASTTLDLKTRLSRCLSPPLFPVPIRDLPCRLSFHDVPWGSFEIGGLKVVADLVCHPGPTLGYRISEGGKAVVYLPDHEPALGVRQFPEERRWTSGMDLASGADVLIHDAQYTAEEYGDHIGWGHSSIPQALAFAAAAGVGRLVAFHHDPDHDDSALDDLLEKTLRSADLSFELVVAAEGGSFCLGDRPLQVG
jgi:phosphoribosyl 1,2-cyclic phosphodiesterase